MELKKYCNLKNFWGHPKINAQFIESFEIIIFIRKLTPVFPSVK